MGFSQKAGGFQVPEFATALGNRDTYVRHLLGKKTKHTKPPELLLGQATELLELFIIAAGLS